MDFSCRYEHKCIIFVSKFCNMARPRHANSVQIPPRIKGFTPVGYCNGECEPLLLYLEELEVIRLLDYEGLSQEEAARLMQRSRSSVTRIYQRARATIAKALVEGVEVKIESGNGFLNCNWFFCSGCKVRFNNPKGNVTNECVLCGSTEIVKMEGCV